MIGKFIVIEGLDGCGKSTQLSLLRDYYKNQGRKCEYIHFPKMEQGVYGALVAEFLRGEFGSIDNVHPKLVALLFANDRLEKVDLIRNWLKEGAVVLSDRFVFSNIAYQCAKLSSEEEKKSLKKWILDFEYNHNNLPEPDLSFFLNVPFSHVENVLREHRSGDDRAYLNGEKDIHESSLDFQRNVLKEYQGLLQSESQFIDIQCSKDGRTLMDLNEIHKEILNYLNKVR